MGLILFEMLTGCLYKNQPPGIRASQLCPDIPVTLDNFLERMLDQDPGQRPWNGAAVEAALAGLADLRMAVGPWSAQENRGQIRREAEKGSSPNRGTRGHPPHIPHRRKFPGWAIGLIAIIALGLMVFLTLNATVLFGRRLSPPKCLEIGQIWVSSIDYAALVCVPAGEFLMGSTDADKRANDDEKPQHTVYLDAYWIDQTEVTNAQYAECVADEACQPPKYNGSSSTHIFYYGNDKYAAYPVVSVTWQDANDYCTWAKRRLPSEAQWEKAARGTDGRLYPWGNQAPTHSLLNYNDNNGDTVQVGSYPAGASPYGAMDMAGNVWEWTADWYEESYYYTRVDWYNPPGPTSGDGRVARGGAWYYAANIVRTTYRHNGIPLGTVNDRGFRCAFDPNP